MRGFAGHLPAARKPLGPRELQLSPKELPAQGRMLLAPWGPVNVLPSLGVSSSLPSKL